MLAFVLYWTIEWKFTCPSAVPCGWLDENLVWPIKTGLKKMLGRRLVNKTELARLLKDVEDVGNSGHLPYGFNEVEEPYLLSPAEFLVGRRLTALPPYAEH